jgi:phosphoribosylformylglycinamidine synthase
MVGLLDDIQKRSGHGFVSENDAIALIHPKDEAPLPKSCAHEYVWLETGQEGGDAPPISLDAEKAVQTACRRGIHMGLVHSAHDLSEGGLGISLAESAIASSKSRFGAEVWLPEQEGRVDGLLYGEAASRILVSVSPLSVNALQEVVQSCGAELTRIGRVQEDAFVVKTPDNVPLIDLAMPKIVAAWADALSEVL